MYMYNILTHCYMYCLFLSLHSQQPRGVLLALNQIKGYRQEHPITFTFLWQYVTTRRFQLWNWLSHQKCVLISVTQCVYFRSTSPQVPNSNIARPFVFMESNTFYKLIYPKIEHYFRHFKCKMNFISLGI